MVSSSSLSLGMEEHTQQVRPQQKSAWSAVPQFGDWDQKSKGEPADYSVMFARARENRKQHKNDVCRSLGNEKELLEAHQHHHHHLPPHQRDGCRSPRRNKKILTYFTACMKPHF